jgi:hypothetical protein
MKMMLIISGFVVVGVFAYAVTTSSQVLLKAEFQVADQGGKIDLEIKK